METRVAGESAHAAIARRSAVGAARADVARRSTTEGRSIENAGASAEQVTRIAGGATVPNPRIAGTGIGHAGVNDTCVG